MSPRSPRRPRDGGAGRPGAHRQPPRRGRRSARRPMTSTSLVALLREARGHYVNQGVVIRGDASLAYQDLADVLSACDEAGIRNVRLPVRSRDEQPTPQPSTTLERRARRSIGRTLGNDARRARTGTGISADARRPSTGAQDGTSSAALRHPDPPQPRLDQRLRGVGGAVASYAVLVPDHLRRDGAGGDAVPAGRFAALRRRRRDGQRRLADQAGHDGGAAGRGRDPRRRGELRHRVLRRAAGLLAARSRGC